MEMLSTNLFWLLPLCLCIGGYVAWNIGANDVSNAMGTSVGSKTLTLKQAIFIAAIFEFIGAAFFGSEVSETLQEGLFNSSAWANNSLITTKGMLASLLAAGVWMHLASLYKLPVSTTHSIVGAIVGFALIAGGFGSIYWGKVGSIALSWILSPCLGAMASFVVFYILKKWIFSQPDPLARARKFLPWMSFFSVAWIGTLWLTINPHKTSLFQVTCVFLLSLIIACIIWAAERWMVPKESTEEKVFTKTIASFVVLQRKKRTLLLNIESDPKAQKELKEVEKEIERLSPFFQKEPAADIEKKQYQKLEMLFGILQVLTACLMAFAHGSNDVANAIGPLNACLSNLAKSGVSEANTLLPYMLPIGGFFIVIGLATWGWRVIETIGSGITELTPSRGFAAEFGASSTIFLASKLGIPVSTTHILVGAVIGVGFAGGFASINTKTLREIATSWFITIPAGALLSILFFSLLSLVVPT
jgi:phosphate/sulfate permease